MVLNDDRESEGGERDPHRQRQFEEAGQRDAADALVDEADGGATKHVDGEAEPDEPHAERRHEGGDTEGRLDDAASQPHSGAGDDRSATAAQPRSFALPLLAARRTSVVAVTAMAPSTDRSMLPRRMMKVVPIAMVRGTAAELARRIRFRGSMKFGLAIVTSTQSTIRTKSGAKARTAPAPHPGKCAVRRRPPSLPEDSSEDLRFD